MLRSKQRLTLLSQTAQTVGQLNVRSPGIGQVSERNSQFRPLGIRTIELHSALFRFLAERLEILDLETYVIERPSFRSDCRGVGFSECQVYPWQVVGVVRAPFPWLGAKHLGIPGLDFLD